MLLLGIDAGGGAAALLGGLMVVLASLGYALGAYYLKRNLSGDRADARSWRPRWRPAR